ncbi:MAG TPA: hypothetical protein VGK73_22925 [Polyangiaceae bacterium]
MSYRIRVPRDWLERGATIEFELPRHLTCAACDGGGCDPCHRSGAVTLRGRNEPSDLVQVSLPQGMRDEAFLIRIPERGGLPPANAILPRGLLFLRVEPTDADASTSVAIRSRVSEVVPPPVSSTTPVKGPGFPRGVAVALLLAISILLVVWLVLRK